jgi:hypothetical protein
MKNSANAAAAVKTLFDAITGGRGVVTVVREVEPKKRRAKGKRA